MIEIDGAQGEGGGQILRSSLSLAICTQQPFRLVDIRANRDQPGLRRQHLTAVKAAAEICAARVEGAELGSRALTFRPGPVRAGDYSFAIGTAGSSSLVLQTVLPPLLKASAQSRVRITGGTHNRGSPPFDFLERAFLRQLRGLGADVELMLGSHGFYPRGGGEIRARIAPAKSLGALDLTTRGSMTRGFAEAYVAGLPGRIAQRELEVIGAELGWGRERLHLRSLANDEGPGNVVTITLEFEHVTEVFTGFGERGIRAETVALDAAQAARDYLAAVAPVDEHLADQLLLPMVLGRGGRFLVTAATEHLRTNASVVERFTDRRVRIEPAHAGTLVTVSGMGPDPTC
jgi:RNA 3'-terminal phosphate cyclase (ATP)